MNDEESHIKLPKMFADKKLETTQKASRTDFNKKGLTRCSVLKIDAWVATKHKIILV